MTILQRSVCTNSDYWASLRNPLNQPINLKTDGSDFKGERLTVQFARGPRRKENFSGPMDRPSMPRPRRTMFRMRVSGLPETSWQVSSPTLLTWIPGFFCICFFFSDFMLYLALSQNLQPKDYFPVARLSPQDGVTCMGMLSVSSPTTYRTLEPRISPGWPSECMIFGPLSLPTE